VGPVGIEKRDFGRCTSLPCIKSATGKIAAPQHPCHVQQPDEVYMATGNRPPLTVMRDTRAWQLQVWVSFGLAVFLCATGLAYLPGQDLDRAFMVMGYVFCLSTVFVLSKAVRDAHQAGLRGEPETPMWRVVVWGGFAVAMGLTLWGLLRMQIDATYKAYLGVSWLYLVTSAFTLAKTLRDRHEADLADARGARHEQAQAERALDRTAG
jgi:hypothetical protein